MLNPTQKFVTNLAVSATFGRNEDKGFFKVLACFIEPIEYISFFLQLMAVWQIIEDP